MLRSKSQTNPHHHREYVIPREMWDIFAKSFMSAKKRSDENSKSEVTTEKSGPETEAKTSPVSENPITETKNVRLQYGLMIQLHCCFFSLLCLVSI